MLYSTARAVALLLSFSTVFSSPSSSPPQLAFGSPSQLEEPHQHLIRLAWSNRNDLEAAVDLLERHNVDVWSARKRSNPSSDLFSSTFSPSEYWETIVRWSGDDEPLTSLLDRLSEAGVPHPDVDTQVSSLSSHLSSPLIASSYSRTLSSATLVNSTSYSSPLAPTDDPIHATYHPYDGIYQILQDFERAYPEWVSVFSIGQSSEGREIWAVKVSNLSNTPEEARTASSDHDADEEVEEEDNLPEFAPAPLRINTKKRHKHRRDRPLNFVVAGGQHAREWIAPSTILYLIHDLVAVGEGEGQRKSEKIRAKLLNQVEFTFVPVVNPDGYIYSWDHDRLWRKSRQEVGKDCFGIDLNRNWGFHFAPGTHPNPCSDSYPGAEAFQSVELRVLSNFLGNKEKPVDAFLDVHSFGQMLLYPYSYTCSLTTPDEENQSEALLRMSAALKRVHGRQFETGSVCEVSLTSPGESLDWTYSTAKIRWSFATELRDAGVFGFLLPPSQIRPSGEEMSAGLRSLTQFVLDKEAGKR